MRQWKHLAIFSRNSMFFLHRVQVKEDIYINVSRNAMMLPVNFFFCVYLLYCQVLICQKALHSDVKLNKKRYFRDTLHKIYK